MLISPKYIALAVAGVALLAGVVGGKSFLSHYSAAVADAQAARAAEASAVARADSAAHTLVVAQAAAKALDAQRVAAISRADSAARQTTQLRSQLGTAVAAAPDTCRPAILAAQAVITADSTQIVELHTALQVSIAERDTVNAALDTARAALQRISTSSTTLIHADATLEKRSKPSLLARILPHPGLGLSAGVDATGAPHTILGFTLGWTF